MLCNAHLVQFPGLWARGGARKDLVGKCFLVESIRHFGWRARDTVFAPTGSNVDPMDLIKSDDGVSLVQSIAGDSQGGQLCALQRLK